MRKLQPILFYTVGLPGGGKTTFSRQLADTLNVTHIYGDRVGYELFGLPNFSLEQIKQVCAEMNRLASAGLAEGSSVIYDACINTASRRKQLQILAHDNGGISVGVWIDTPPDIARQRAGEVRISEFAENYFRIIPRTMFETYCAAFEAPEPHEKVLHVAGTVPYLEQLAAIQSQLQTICPGLVL